MPNPTPPSPVTHHTTRRTLLKGVAAAAKQTDNKFWLWDGIHPTPAGHAFMVETWRRTVGV